MSVARDIEKYKLNIITRVLYYNGSSIRNLCMVSNNLFTVLAMGLIELE